MAKKIKKIALVTKEDLAQKEEIGVLPKKHKNKGKDFIPVNIEEYKKIAKLREKLNKNKPTEK
ncbi:MAG: hypothetical protein IJS60_10295 [Abditibacteriota bacterium]|nr:hypothetical protein [Abditibacteriota bacterium]